MCVRLLFPAGDMVASALFFWSCAVLLPPQHQAFRQIDLPEGRIEDTPEKELDTFIYKETLKNRALQQAVRDADLPQGRFQDKSEKDLEPFMYEEAPPWTRRTDPRRADKLRDEALKLLKKLVRHAKQWERRPEKPFQEEGQKTLIEVDLPAENEDENEEKTAEEREENEEEDNATERGEENEEEDNATERGEENEEEDNATENEESEVKGAAEVEELVSGEAENFGWKKNSPPGNAAETKDKSAAETKDSEGKVEVKIDKGFDTGVASSVEGEEGEKNDTDWTRVQVTAKQLRMQRIVWIGSVVALSIVLVLLAIFVRFFWKRKSTKKEPAPETEPKGRFHQSDLFYFLNCKWLTACCERRQKAPAPKREVGVNEVFTPSPEVKVDRTKVFTPSPDVKLDWREEVAPAPEMVMDRYEVVNPAPGMMMERNAEVNPEFYHSDRDRWYPQEFR